MDRKQILIDIIARFTEQGLKQVSGELNRFVKGLSSAAQGKGLGGLASSISGLAGGAIKAAGPLGLVVSALIALHQAGVPIIPAFATIKKSFESISAPAEKVRAFIDRIKTGLAELARGAVAGAGKAIAGGFTLIGRAAAGALSPITNFIETLVRGLRSRAITQVFNSIAEGFNFIKEAALEGNAALETTANTFRAFAAARGAVPAGRDIGAEQLRIVRELALQTGVSFADLIRASRRFPQIVGNNLEQFTKLVRQTINLAFLDPDQGLKGAAFAISNATEGTARGFTSLRTRFEVNAAVINRALHNTADPIAALDQVLNDIGVTESFVTDQTNTFAVAGQQVTGVLNELFRLGGEPVFELLSQQVQRFRDALFELRPQLFGIARAIGSAIVEIINRLGIFESSFLDTFDPIEAFRTGVEFVRKLVNGFFTAINQYLIPALRSLVGLITGAFGGGQVAQATEEQTKETTDFAGSLDRLRNKFDEVNERRRQAIESAKAQAEAEMAAAQAAAQAARDAALLAALQERVAKAGARLIDLKESEKNQKAILKQLEGTLRGAKRAVDNARDRLKLFDLQTADIPERFTRARRRQLELEVLRAEQAARQRQDAAEIAREQLEITREQVRLQDQLFDKLQALLDKEKERQGEIAEEGAAGIDTGLVETSLAVGELEEQTAKFAEEAANIIKPLTDDFVAGVEAIKEGLAGINFGPIADMIIQGISAAIQVFLTFITTVQSKWNEVVLLFQDRGILGTAIALGKDIGVSLIASMTRAISDWLRANPITGPIANWIADGAQAAWELLKEGGGIGSFLEDLPIGGGGFGPQFGTGFGLNNLPSFGLGGLLANLILNLDADETRRIMEEGSYQAIQNVMLGSQ